MSRKLDIELRMKHDCAYMAFWSTGWWVKALHILPMPGCYAGHLAGFGLRILWNGLHNDTRIDKVSRPY